MIQQHLVLDEIMFTTLKHLSLSLSLKHTHFYTFLIHSQHTYLTLYALYTLDALGACSCCIPDARPANPRHSPILTALVTQQALGYNTHLLYRRNDNSTTRQTYKNRQADLESWTQAHPNINTTKQQIMAELLGISKDPENIFVIIVRSCEEQLFGPS